MPAKRLAPHRTLFAWAATLAGMFSLAFLSAVVSWNLVVPAAWWVGHRTAWIYPQRMPSVTQPHSWSSSGGSWKGWPANSGAISFFGLHIRWGEQARRPASEPRRAP